MTLDISKNSDNTVITVSGRLDTVTAPTLDSAITDKITPTEHLVLDLESLTYISSAGLRVLLSAQKKMQTLGSMKLIHVCKDVMDILEMTGFADILEVE